MEGLLYFFAILVAFSATFEDSLAETAAERMETSMQFYDMRPLREVCSRKYPGSNKRQISACAKKMFDSYSVAGRHQFLIESISLTRPDDPRKSADLDSYRSTLNGAEQIEELPRRSRTNEHNDESTKVTKELIAIERSPLRSEDDEKLTKDDVVTLDEEEIQTPRSLPKIDDKLTQEQIDIIVQSEKPRSRPQKLDGNTKSAEDKTNSAEHDGLKKNRPLTQDVDESTKSVEDKTNSAEHDEPKKIQRISTEESIEPKINSADSDNKKTIESTVIEPEDDEDHSDDSSSDTKKSEIREAVRRILERQKKSRRGNTNKNVNKNSNVNKISDGKEDPKFRLFVEDTIERSRSSRINAFKRRDRNLHLNKNVNKNVNSNTNVNDITIEEPRRPREDHEHHVQHRDHEPHKYEESHEDDEEPKISTTTTDPLFDVKLIPGDPINKPIKNPSTGRFPLVAGINVVENNQESPESSIADTSVADDESSNIDKLLTETILKVLIINKGGMSSAKVERLTDLLNQLSINEKEMLLRELNEATDDPITIKIDRTKVKEVKITESKPKIIVGRWVVGRSALNSKPSHDDGNDAEVKNEKEDEGDQKTATRVGPIVVNTSYFPDPPKKMNTMKQQPMRQQQGRTNPRSGFSNSDDDETNTIILDDDASSDREVKTPLGSRSMGKSKKVPKKKKKVPKSRVVEEDSSQDSDSNVNSNVNTNTNTNTNQINHPGSRRTITEINPITIGVRGNTKTSKRHRITQLDIGKKIGDDVLSAKKIDKKKHHHHKHGHKDNHGSESVNKNVNKNTNTNIIKDHPEDDNDNEDNSVENRRGRLSHYRPRPSKLNVSKNKNINKNVNINTNSNVNIDGDVSTEYRRSLDNSQSHNVNSNTNTNVNTNDNRNVDQLNRRHVNKRKPRKDQVKKNTKSVDSLLRDVGVLRTQLEEEAKNGDSV